jgi:hypothetical protein
MQVNGAAIGTGPGGGCGDTGGEGASDLQAFFAHSCFLHVARGGWIPSLGIGYAILCDAVN